MGGLCRCQLVSNVYVNEKGVGAAVCATLWCGGGRYDSLQMGGHVYVHVQVEGQGRGQVYVDVYVYV
jgi:hypothetical protein